MDKDITEFNIDFYNLNSKKTTRHKLKVVEGRHPKNYNVIWNCDFNFNGHKIVIRDEYFLSDVMKRIREVIEPLGYRALVVCAEIDASHSGMQADMTNGTIIYNLKSKDNAGKMKSRHVFDKSSIDLVVNLQEQENFKKDYFEQLRK